MQIDISGAWIYIYSGGIHGKFSSVETFPVQSIQRVRIDEKAATITIYVGGSPILVTFEGNCLDIVREFYFTLNRLSDTLAMYGCDAKYLTNLNRRRSPD